VTWLHAGARLGYLHPWIRRGHDPLFPSIEDTFTDATAPGLAQQPTFLHASVYTDVDSRDVPGNPRSGGFYHLAYAQWNDRSFNAFDFRRFDINATQHVPLNAAQTHILSPDIGLSLVNNAPGQRVPFYFLPYVGGIDTVRGFREFRFSDENALWFGAEYRWIAAKWWSLALFTDAGKVTHRWDEMDLGDLKHAYGFGILIHSPKQTFAKFYVGSSGGEGVRTYLQLGI
jgi:outer membrane protein assembly factor BamA